MCGVRLPEIIRGFFTPTLIGSFEKWLARYCDEGIIPEGELKLISLSRENEKIYQELQTIEMYVHAILNYISGMTDRFAISLFNELVTCCLRRSRKSSRLSSASLSLASPGTWSWWRSISTAFGLSASSPWRTMPTRRSQETKKPVRSMVLGRGHSRTDH